MADIALLFYDSESQTGRCCVKDGLCDLFDTNWIYSNFVIGASLAEGMGKCLEIVFCKDEVYHRPGSDFGNSLVFDCQFSDIDALFAKYGMVQETGR